MLQPIPVGMPMYSEFIYLSRYARFLHEKGRRENWSETIARYFDFFKEHLKEQCDFKLSDSLRSELEEAVLSMKIMPSMRAVMTAGPALARDNIAGYNCSFSTIDKPKAFSELMYILLNGTGVGFSVEREYVKKLPEIPEAMYPSDTTIVVGDSKLGWAKSFNELISLLYTGYIPKWDLSNVRPAGSILKTFGGRASGPEPLNDLFNFVIATFEQHKGRQLTSLAVHDICCMVGSCVVVGGVRRSALISLSDLSDSMMRTAKSGQWWTQTPYRQLSNNSAVYTNGKPTMDAFMDEWHSLYASKSGERGIASRSAMKANIQRSNKFREEHFEKTSILYRDEDHSYGTNPCCFSKDTWIHTVFGPQKIKDLVNKQTVIWSNDKPVFSRTGSWVSGEKELFQINTLEGYVLKCTNDHRLMSMNGNWCLPRNLKEGDKIKLHHHKNLSWNGKGTQDEGYLLGLFVGDGNWSKAQSKNGNYFGQVKVWKKDIGYSTLKETVERCWKNINLDRRSDAHLWCDYKRYSYSLFNISKLPLLFGFDPKDKHNLECIETCSSDFYQGFLRGFFDADGHVEGSVEYGHSVRISQVRYDTLQTIQRMLLRLGIYSKIYKQNEASEKFFPDGKGGSKKYNCKACWRLCITSKSLYTYKEIIGFSHSIKNEKLNKAVSSGKTYSQQIYATFKSLISLGIHQVYDIEVESEDHTIDANGFVAHNSEIILRPNQLCNLSEVVVRAGDTLAELKEKVRLATILGTFQSTLTNFKFVSKKWVDNTEEERLLGVSLTGIMDHPILSGRDVLENLKDYLTELRKVAIETNMEWAKKIGIPMSRAITAVKPSGTVSQLVDSASGIHARHAPFYLRSVRSNKRDPLCQLMIDQGFPHEQDKTNSEQVVFSFPIKSPEGSVFRHEMTAIRQLEIWKTYQMYYTEHKPSVTVSVREEEWMEVGAWVYKNFEVMAGVSFLPMSDHIYQQAPYQDITEEEYKVWLEKMPKLVNWSKLGDYEKSDFTTGSGELACVAGCEII